MLEGDGTVPCTPAADRIDRDSPLGEDRDAECEDCDEADGGGCDGAECEGCDEAERVMPQGALVQRRLPLATRPAAARAPPNEEGPGARMERPTGSETRARRQQRLACLTVLPPGGTGPRFAGSDALQDEAHVQDRDATTIPC